MEARHHNYRKHKMTTDTQKLQVATDALKAVKEFNKGHYSFGALDQIVEPALVALATPSTERPHWIDGEQAALGGRTAREGYAANPDYTGSTEQPGAARVDGPEFRRLLTAHAQHQNHVTILGLVAHIGAWGAQQREAGLNAWHATGTAVIAHSAIPATPDQTGDIFDLIREWAHLPEGQRGDVARNIIGKLNQSYAAGMKDGRELGGLEAAAPTSEQAPVADAGAWLSASQAVMPDGSERAAADTGSAP